MLPQRLSDVLTHFAHTFAEGLKVMRSPGHLAVAIGLVAAGLALDRARRSG